MGRSNPSLNNPHNENEGFRGNGVSRPEKISFRNANYLGKQNYNDGTECVGSSNSSKCNGISRKKEDQSYVQDVNSQQKSNTDNYEKDIIREQPINSNVEKDKYSDNLMVPFKYCPNNERIQNLQLSLGKLCRIGVMAGNTWTEEKLKTPCHFVVPNIQYKGEQIRETISHVSKGEKQDEFQEGRNNPKNPFMIVEMIANKLDHNHVAKSLGCHIESRNPTTYKCYMEIIKKYGFDHIILIGDCHAGILFLDCYGHVFKWEDFMSVLWYFGDYWNVTSKESLTRRVIWSVEYDGTVTEFEDIMDDLPNELTFDKPAIKTIDVHPVAKKKKKNLKKKQH